MKPSKETKTQTPNLGNKFTLGTQTLSRIREQTRGIVRGGKTITFVLAMNIKKQLLGRLNTK